MTRQWYKENKHILDAWANGDDVEVFVSGEWQPVNKDREFWMHDCEYRIKPKIEYPVYVKHKKHAIWVKFTSLTEGEVIGMKPPKKDLHTYVGDKSDEWAKVTNESMWEIITNPYELHDKDAVWCRDSGDVLTNELRFWDAKNNRVYSTRGTRTGPKFVYYEKVLPWDEPEWVREARKHLKD